MFKRHNPGCPCCDAACEELCFLTTGCGEPLPGVDIVVYETGVPGVTLASGTTDANGEWCVAMSAHSGKSLSYDTTPDDLADYAGNTGVLIGNWCGRTVTIDHAPAVIPGDPGEAGGTVNVLFTRCDGTTPWASASVEVFVFLDIIDSGTTDADGRVTLAVPADGSTAYQIRAYRPTDSTPLNSGAFTLEAGECADAHMRMNNGGLPCNPDVEAVITVRDCSGATDEVEKLCCGECHPDTVPSVLSLNDPRGSPWCSDVAVNVMTCDTEDIDVTITGRSVGAFSQWSALLLAASASCGRVFFCTANNPLAVGMTYELVCGSQLDDDGTILPPGLYLRVVRYVQCQETDAYGATTYYGYPCRYASWLCPYAIAPAPISSGLVAATSYTCDPFSATFNIPNLTVQGWQLNGGCYVEAGTKTLPARTITVIEP